MSLISHHLELTATALTPLELDAQAGAQVRGAFVTALWGRFCANKAASTCADCPLVRMCPVAALVAPLREEGETGGDQRPRPYVIQPPAGPCRYESGAEFRFSISLFGPAAQLFPYIVMAVQGLEQSGLGRRFAERSGRRGSLRISEIAAINPLTGTRQVLYTPAQPHVQSPGLPVCADDVALVAAALPADRLTLHFRTPLRLIERSQLVHTFAVRPFVQRLKDRLDQLLVAYGDGPPFPRLDFAALNAAVTIVDDATHWVDLMGFSNRQQRGLPLGGLVGPVTLGGQLDQQLRELLVWGSLIHVGKNAVKGDGWYVVEG